MVATAPVHQTPLARAYFLSLVKWLCGVRGARENSKGSSQPLKDISGEALAQINKHIKLDTSLQPFSAGFFGGLRIRL